VRIASWRYLAAGGAAAAIAVPFLVGAGSSRASHRATVSCGQALTASVTLTADLSCPGSHGLVADANGIVVNLNGHTLTGDGSHDGVLVDGHTGVTIENGIVDDFSNGVAVQGHSDGSKVVNLRVFGNGTGVFVGSTDKALVTKVTAVLNSVGLIIFSGTGVQVTANTVVESSTHGIELQDEAGLVASGNKSLNNTDNGFHVIGATTGSLTGNVADGNGANGFFVNPAVAGLGSGLVVSKNRAAFNGTFGIAAAAPGAIDGGGNVVQDNGTAAQCQDVACDEVSS
jgi:hypothetical protein